MLAFLRRIRANFFAGRGGGIAEAVRISLPLVFAMAAHAANQFIDRVFLSRYSDVAIQGSMPGGILSWLFICLILAVVAYSGTFVAQFAGAGAGRDSARAFGQGVLLTVAAVPVFLLCIPLGGAVFNLCGHAPEVMAAEKVYFSTLMVGAIPVTAETVLAGFFTGHGRTRLVSAANIIGNLSNIVLDYVMIFGKWGCPEMGIAGAGWATAISGAVPCVILGAAAACDPLLRGRRFLVALRPDMKMIFRIIRFGFPSGLQNFLDVLTFTVFVMVIGRLDAMSFAVSNICFAVNHLSFAPILGFQQGAAVMVGRYQGAGDSRSTYRAGWSCVFLGWIYFLVFAAAVMLFSDAIMDLFQAENSAFEPAAFRSLGRTLMLILVSWGIFDATMLAIGGALKGAGDTKFVMKVMVFLGVLVWMPAVLIIFVFHPTVVALWMTMPFYCGLTTLFVTVRWVRGSWRSIRLVDGRKKRNLV